MTQQEIKKNVLASIKKVKHTVKIERINDETTLVDDLGLDSMAIMNLASHLEQAFGRSLSLTNWVNENRDQRLTVGSLLKYLEKVVE